jgi:hypothetical protein
LLGFILLALAVYFGTATLLGAFRPAELRTAFRRSPAS